MSNIVATPHLPALGAEGNLALYLREIQKFPMLSAEEEYTLAKNWRQRGDVTAAHRLVTSHLRLVAKIAMGYRGYGLPLADLIAEGNLGMMQAIKKFDPDKGFRLSTYAMWWIRAAIQEYVLHSWSLVKIGTTGAQKKLFFNLRKIKRDLRALDDGDLTPEQVKRIARDLAVSEEDVVQMNRRLGGPDRSLNAPVQADGNAEWQDWLTDEREDQETVLANTQETAQRQKLLHDALSTLNPRERAIIAARRIQAPPATLEDLAQQFKVSRERVRQIEVSAFAKLQKNIRAAAEALTFMPRAENGDDDNASMAAQPPHKAPR